MLLEKRESKVDSLNEIIETYFVRMKQKRTLYIWSGSTLLGQTGLSKFLGQIGYI